MRSALREAGPGRGIGVPAVDGRAAAGSGMAQSAPVRNRGPAATRHARVSPVGPGTHRRGGVMTTTVEDSHNSEMPAVMPRGLVVMIGYCVILATLVTTIPLKWLSPIGAEFGATGGLLNWVVIIGSLSGAIGTALLPPVASLFGQRRTTVVTMSLLTAGSVLGAVAPNMTVL